MDHLAFVVDDVRKAYRGLVRKGVRSAVSPADSEGTEVYVQDPDEVWMELLQQARDLGYPKSKGDASLRPRVEAP